MSDLISRKGIIRAHKEYCEKHPEANWYKWSLSIMQTAPSAEKKGKWIPTGEEDADGNQRYICSACQVEETHSPIVEVSYCWHCGARMEGGE